ncbi:hypothetical protein [Desulfonatronospira thiodismutans]|uniref:hypothetical protein n=1 Tax=Desulfonatronospira thiodismutans TaxID=488939 RepID=UPI001375A8D8|nr:hypothetical protein [Desulfonatronospira thiodismutans]
MNQAGLKKQVWLSGVEKSKILESWSATTGFGEPEKSMPALKGISCLHVSDGL